MMPAYINFPDRCVFYDTFLDDLSARIVRCLQRAGQDPETVSQRQAYAIFGRANVDRWRREGRVLRRDITISKATEGKDWFEYDYYTTAVSKVRLRFYIAPLKEDKLPTK